MLFDIDTEAIQTHKPNIQITQEPFIAFLLGTHKRLGKDSPIRLLNDDILYLIATIGMRSRQKIGLSSTYPNTTLLYGTRECFKIDGCKLVKMPFSDISNNNTVYRICIEKYKTLDILLCYDALLIPDNKWHNILTPIYRNGKLLRILIHQYSSPTIYSTKIYMHRYDRDKIRALQATPDKTILYNGAIYLRNGDNPNSEVNIYIEIVDNGNV